MAGRTPRRRRGRDGSFLRYPNRGAQVVAAAARQAGEPYRYGAAGPNAFACWGLTLYVYRQFGWRLPDGATAQSATAGRGEVGGPPG